MKSLDTALTIHAGVKGINELKRLSDEIKATGTATDSLDKATDELQKSWKGLSADEQTKKVKALGDEFKRLKSISDAKIALGIDEDNKAKKQLEEVHKAYERLKLSGKLTGSELARANELHTKKVKELEEQLGKTTLTASEMAGELGKIAGSAGSMAVVAKAAMEFETAMAGVKKVVDGTPEQMSRLSKEIKDLSVELGMTATEVAQIATMGGQLGVPIDKLGEFTTMAGQMSVAFSMSADEAGNAAAKLANVFNMPIEQVGELGDVINTLGNNMAAKEREIVDAMLRVGGTARQFGLAKEKVAGLTAAMIALGKPPEVASTAINALLTKLQTAQNQGAGFADGLQMIGTSADEMADNIAKNPQQALSGFLEKLGQLDERQRSMVSVKLFGAEYADDINLLVGSLGTYNQALGLATDKTATAGAMQKEFQAQMDTAAKKVTQAKAELMALAINIGQHLLPIISTTAEAVGDMAGTLADIAHEYPTITQLVTLMGGAVVAVKALNSVIALTGSLGGKSALQITTGFLGAKGAIDATAVSADKMNTELGNAGVQTASLAKQMTSLNGIMGALTAWTIGKSIGDWAYENSSAVRAIGDEMGRLLAYADAIFTDRTFDDVRQNFETSAESAKRLADETANAKTATDNLAQSQDNATDTALAQSQANTELINSLAIAKAELEQLEIQLANMGMAGQKNTQDYKDLQTQIEATKTTIKNLTDEAQNQGLGEAIKSDLEKASGAFGALGLDMDEFATGIDGKTKSALQGFSTVMSLAGDDVNKMAMAYNAVKAQVGDNAKAQTELNGRLLEAVNGNKELAQSVKDTATAQQNAKKSADEQAKALDALGVSMSAINSMYVRAVSFRPASSADVVSDTAKIIVSENTQSYNYIVNLPHPSTVSVQYRSQGKWYRLTQGSQTHGSINLNPQTGTLSITCSELPDIGSAIVIYWGSSATFIKRADLVPSVKSVIRLPTTPDPSSITLSWSGGSATVNAQGVISGDVTGRYSDSVLTLDSAITGVTVGYNTGDKISQNHPTPARDLQGNVSIDIGDFVAGTLQLTYPVTVEGYDEIALGAVISTSGRKGRNITQSGDGSHGTYGAGTVFITLTDDGKGNLIDSHGKTVGKITGGKAIFNPDTTVSIPKAKYGKDKIGEKVYSQTETELTWNNITYATKTYQDIYRTSFAGFDYVPAGATLASNAVITASYYDTHPATAKSEPVAVSTSIKFVINTGELIIPSSVRFVMNGKSYFDKDGSIYTNLNTATGQADKIGSIDYSTGELILSDPIGAVSVQSLTTSVSAGRTDSISFITPSAPIRPSSLTISATTLDGKKISATANAKGEFDSEYILGLVDVEYGLASVKFGKWVNADGHESESWYNADAVVDGQIFKPAHVFSSSITYSTVAYSYLPVDSTTIRIDTVRLPQDGRVPIFRRGDTILITNSLKQALGSAHKAGQTIQLDRTYLDRLCITDSTGKAVNAELWDYDLEAGSITWTSPLDLSDYALPLFATCTWEERNRIHSVDIDGTLTLIFPTKRDYPLEDTYVASVLIGGNLQVRASVPFTQRNWTNVWQDARIGDEPLNRLNVKDYPIVLTDDGAIDEKWLIKFTSSSQFELYGQTLGFVLKTDTLQDLAPINPSTKKPYFTIPKQAFGADTPWSVQEVVRFNTWGTLLPVWVICAVQPSADNPKGSDGYTQVLFGDTTEI